MPRASIVYKRRDKRLYQIRKNHSTIKPRCSHILKAPPRVKIARPSRSDEVKVFADFCFFSSVTLAVLSFVKSFAFLMLSSRFLGIFVGQNAVKFYLIALLYNIIPGALLIGTLTAAFGLSPVTEIIVIGGFVFGALMVFLAYIKHIKNVFKR